MEQSIPMDGDPTRTLLLLSPRPHPWASLRDRLEGPMLRVAWRPSAPPADGKASPWAVAGEGEVRPDAIGPGSLIWWVGASGPSGVRPCQNWSALTVLVQDALRASVGGVRLAPGCGVEWPGVGYVQGLGWLETLIGAGPAGVQAPDADQVRRMRAALRRRRLPLTLVETAGRLRVESGR